METLESSSASKCGKALPAIMATPLYQAGIEGGNVDRSEGKLGMGAFQQFLKLFSRYWPGVKISLSIIAACSGQ